MEVRLCFRVEVVVSEGVKMDVGDEDVRVRRERPRSTLYRPEDLRAFKDADGITGEEVFEDDRLYDVPEIARIPLEKNSE